MAEDADRSDAYDIGKDISDRLVKDLNADKFVLYFQSIVPVAAPSEESGFREILIRCKQEERDMLPPGMFLPLLEQHGLMPLMDRWIVSRVLKWSHEAKAAFGSRPSPRSSVNLSSDTLRRDRTFGDFVLRSMESTGVPGESLSFEILMSDALVQGESLARLVGPLGAAGCGFSLCGFTDDQIGLDHAASLGASFIKLDGSVAYCIGRDPQAEARLDAVIRRCRTLGMRTICTQVETHETLAILRKLGIDYAQGFGIARPCLLEPFTGKNNGAIS